MSLKKSLEKVGKIFGYKYFRYCLPFKKKYKEHRNEIETVKKLFTDQLSEKVFDAMAKYWATRNYSDVSAFYNNSFEITYSELFNNKIKFDKLFDASQYFVQDLVKLSENEVFVDGGGFIGDTAMNFIKKSDYKFKKVHIFEPEKNNYETLKEYYKLMNIDMSKVLVHNAGLSNENKEVNFDPNGWSSCKTDNSQGEICKLVALDRYLSEEELSEITYIKLDIEGSETDAIEGMSETIKRYKPKMAVCIYHKPADIWEIPLLLHKLNPEYKISLRQHGKQYETVCYAL